MRLNSFLASLALCVLTCSATAKVIDAEAGGFTVEHEVVIAASRSVVWHAAVDEIGQWWSDDHTVAGDARRLHIQPKPMGCFCERLQGDDGIVHLIVTSASTNVILRMTGGLGPLGLMGVNGNMTWEFFDANDSTRVRFVYAVGGYAPGGLDTIADAVDIVIGEALALLKIHVERIDGDASD